MSDFTLSLEQQHALDKIKMFIDSDHTQIFVLKGYAGTGKTTLLKHVSEYLSTRRIPFTLLAPTGRAAAVLRQKTGIHAKTIHSELYEFIKVDGEPEISEPELDHYGQMRLNFGLKKPSLSSEKKLYIIDESSMISDITYEKTSFASFGSGRLLNDLLDVAGKNKIIFCGDPAQLPPVGSDASPALKEEEIRQYGKKVESFELTNILRQKKDNGILLLAHKVRKLATSNTTEKWIKIPARNTPDVSLLPSSNMLESFLDQLERTNEGELMAISTSNIQCLEINKAVRERKYGNAFHPLQKGDSLMVTQNNYLVPLANGDLITVCDVFETRTHAGLDFIRVKVKTHHSVDTIFETLLCIQPLFSGKPNLSSEQQKQLMIQFSIRMRELKITPNSQQYKEELMKDPYLNSLRANFGYAITCHKSQGGEWDRIYLFLNKGMYIMDSATLSRWWYTGITRARSRLIITDDWWIS